MKEYKKSYIGFCIWLAVFILLYLPLPYLINWCIPLIDPANVVKFMMEFLFLALAALMMIIFYTQNIYWLHRVSFEQASAMTPGERKTVALFYLRVITVALGILTVYNIVGVFIRTGSLTDVAAAVIILVAATVFTIKFT